VRGPFNSVANSIQLTSTVTVVDTSVFVDEYMAQSTLGGGVTACVVVCCSVLLCVAVRAAV